MPAERVKRWLRRRGKRREAFTVDSTSTEERSRREGRRKKKESGCRRPAVIIGNPGQHYAWETVVVQHRFWSTEDRGPGSGTRSTWILPHSLVDQNGARSLLTARCSGDVESVIFFSTQVPSNQVVAEGGGEGRGGRQGHLRRMNPSLSHLSLRSSLSLSHGARDQQSAPAMAQLAGATAHRPQDRDKRHERVRRTQEDFAAKGSWSRRQQGWEPSPARRLGPSSI